MDPQRRNLLAWSGAAAAAAATTGSPAAAAPERLAGGTVSALGLDAASLGVRPGSPDDQSTNFQRAIDRASAMRAPLALGPGTYRTGALRLPSGAAVSGIKGATRIVFAGGPSLFTAAHAEHVTLRDLVLDGAGKPLPPNQGLVHFEDVGGARIADCAVLSSGGHGIRFASVEGNVTGTSILDAADMALLSSDGRGLTVSGNTVGNAGNAGIVIIRGVTGHDGTMVLDNRINDIRNRDGGTGQFGNAINVFRAADVIVRGNVIRRCAFSGVRGNAASAIQIIGNSVHEAGEVALYSEFGFEGAIVANNIVDGAQTGVSIANFNEGGRLAVVHGNIFRNLAPQMRNPPPGELLGIGIYVEADTAVSANVVEGARAAGIALGWGPYFRDVAVTGNVVRQSTIGIAVSVVAGAGAALIASNVVSQAAAGAIVGMDHARAVTGDLVRDGARPFTHLSVSGNRA